MSSIGNKIKYYREKKGWSQIELSKRVGINNSVLSRIESGDRPIKDHEIEKFADVFGVSIYSLLNQGSIAKEQEVSYYTSREKEFLENLHLSEDELIDKYKLIIDGKEVTEDELKAAIKYIKFLRHDSN